MIVRTASNDTKIQCNYEPESKTRTLVDKLLQVNEVKYLQDKIGKDSDRDDEWEELISGWGNSFVFPRAPCSLSRRSDAKRKSSKSFGPEIAETNIAIRCVNEDFSSDHYKLAWKANVEPGTYRYIVNNGYYRTSKFSAAGRSWVTAKRSRKPERGSMSNNEIRNVQKSLKRDLDFRFSQSQDSHSQTDDHGSSEGKVVSEEHPIDHNNTAMDDHVLNESLTSRTVFVDVNAKPFHHMHRVESAPNLSSKSSVHSGKSRFREDALLHENAPNFQTPYRISHDPFTITPFLRAESTLKPLEKLTPQQKLIERRASESERHSSSIACDTQKSFTATRNGLKFQPAAHHGHNLFSDWPTTDSFNSNVDSGLVLSSYINKGVTTSGLENKKSVPYSPISKPTINDLSRILGENSKVLKSNLANGIVSSEVAVKKKSNQGYKYVGSQYVHGGGLSSFLGANNLTSNVDRMANPVSDQFGNGNALPLPEISGKRIVMETHQRTL